MSQQKIEEILARKKLASTAMLSQELGISKASICRSLKKMIKYNEIFIMAYGRNGWKKPIPFYALSKDKNIDQKNIAKSPTNFYNFPHIKFVAAEA